MNISPASTTQNSRPSLSKLLLTACAIILAAVLLYYSLRGIDWKAVVGLLRHAHPEYLAIACALFTSSLFLRSIRWRILLQAQGKIPVGTVFWATSVGYFGNNFLPARAGELARTLMISSHSSISTTCVLTTALLERMSDAVALVIICAIVSMTVPSPPAWLAKTSRPFAIIGGCSVLAIAFLPRMERWGKLALQCISVPERIRSKLLGMLEQIMEGIRTFHDTKRLIGFVCATCVIWCLDAVGTVAGGSALGLTIPLPVAFLLIAALGLGSALPSTPGYVGIYQFVAVTVLTPFGFSRTDAIAYILLAQAISYLLIGFWGTLGLWQNRRLGRIRDAVPLLSEDARD